MRVNWAAARDKEEDENNEVSAWEIVGILNYELDLKIHEFLNKKMFV
jgi:hypothetical protein